MNADEIMQVLRLTAMSRVNHPDQQRFCDKLAEVFAGWVAPVAEKPAVPESDVQASVGAYFSLMASRVPSEGENAPAKRGRKPKAE